MTNFVSDFKVFHGNTKVEYIGGIGAECYILHVVFILAARCRNQTDRILDFWPEHFRLDTVHSEWRPLINFFWNKEINDQDLKCVHFTICPHWIWSSKRLCRFCTRKCVPVEPERVLLILTVDASVKSGGKCVEARVAQGCVRPTSIY